MLVGALNVDLYNWRNIPQLGQKLVRSLGRPFVSECLCLWLATASIHELDEVNYAGCNERTLLLILW